MAHDGNINTNTPFGRFRQLVSNLGFRNSGELEKYFWMFPAGYVREIFEGKTPFVEHHAHMFAGFLQVSKEWLWNGAEVAQTNVQAGSTSLGQTPYIIGVMDPTVKLLTYQPAKLQPSDIRYWRMGGLSDDVTALYEIAAEFSQRRDYGARTIRDLAQLGLRVAEHFVNDSDATLSSAFIKKIETLYDRHDARAKELFAEVIPSRKVALAYEDAAKLCARIMVRIAMDVADREAQIDLKKPPEPLARWLGSLSASNAPAP